MRINPKPVLLALIDQCMTRTEACARARIGIATFAKLERGEMIRLQSLRKLCFALGIKPKDVLVNGLAPTPTQRAQNMGDGKRAQEADDRD